MPAKKQQTHAKRARELAVKERRERKVAKKAEAAARRAAGLPPLGSEFPADEAETDDAVAETTDDSASAELP
jgi:hypothetical protein